MSIFFDAMPQALLFRDSQQRLREIRPHQMIRRILGAIFLLLAISTAWADAAAVPTTPLWSQLDYKASKLLVSVQIHIGLANVQAADTVKGFVAPRRGTPVAASGPELYALDVHTKFLTQNTDIRLWLNPDGSVLQRTSLNTGRKNRYRAFRYLQDGAYSVKRQPRDGEKGQEYAKWTDVTEDDYLYDPPTSGVTEGEALFIIAATAPLEKPEDTVTFPVFSPDGLGRATAKFKGMTKISARYEELSPSGSREIDGKIDVMHLSFNIDPMKEGVSKDAFELLGLQGDINLYVDPKRRILIQLSGTTESIGALDVKLRKAVVK